MTLLLTVEYEELHAGQTAEGTGMFWLKKCEPFASNMYDDNEKRALMCVDRLKSEPDTYRRYSAHKMDA